jgi:hypothetical protein
LLRPCAFAWRLNAEDSGSVFFFVFLFLFLFLFSLFVWLPRFKPKKKTKKRREVEGQRDTLCLDLSYPGGEYMISWRPGPGQVKDQKISCNQP